ncbi:histidinol-phosphatase [Apiospora kogelbergensis]|uniref:histidinol-phosphatase n=1 Tax=Apiospora kogelbergensis TaxID=1337665 RepID=UPI003130D6FC
MAFTMHSHSGQFCPGHAQDQLEEVIKHAISVGYKTIGLTEHMPRTDLEDLYPEELDEPEKSLAELAPRHEAYLKEAQRLQAAYASQIHILIGFEGEWLRPSYGPFIKSLAAEPCIDYFMGSLHHVNAIPIDYDSSYYQKAVASAGGTEEKLYERYYDQQFEMLQALKPLIVGHFDLCRLMSSDPERDVRQWASVWEKVVRNLQFVVSYGGWLECNTSALRKGMAEPYPCRTIAEEYLKLGGKFTMSDDSHGIAQVATNYKKGLEFLESIGVSHVWTLERTPQPGDAGNKKATLANKAVPVVDIKDFFD